MGGGLIEGAYLKILVQGRGLLERGLNRAFTVSISRYGELSREKVHASLSRYFMSNQMSNKSVST